jgi:hypothetical protein
LNRKTWPEQPVVDGNVADGDGSRRGVTDLLAEPEILEKIAGAGLEGGRAHWGSYNGIYPAPPFSQNREANASFLQREADEDV